MWSSHNSGNKGIPGQNGAQDNSNQSNTINQVNLQENYQGNEINVGSEYFVNFSPLAAGFPVYPLFPFDYYQPPFSDFMGNYMFQPMPGFGNNGFMQTAFTNTANPQEVQPQWSVAPAHSGLSTQSVPSIRSTTSAQLATPTQTIVLARPATSMALNSRAEELKAQLIKSKKERVKAKNGLKAEGAGASTLDPTSQEMASLLRGSPTVLRNLPKVSTGGSTVLSISPKEVLRGVVVNTESKSTRNQNPSGGTAAELKTHKIEVTKLLADDKATAENYKTHLGANGLPASKIQPSPDGARAVQDNAQSKGSQTKLNLMHSKPAVSQVAAFRDIGQKTTVSKELQEKVQTKECVLEVVGKGKLPSAPSAIEDKVHIKAHSSTTMQDKMPAPRHEYPGRRGSSSNTTDKTRIDDCAKGKNNSSARNGANTVHSPKGDRNSSLEKVLLSNDDLRDWLKMTKWDDLAHRKRALERHRTITAIDTEKARLLETVAKIEALDKEKAKIEAEMTEDEGEVGVKSPGHPAKRSTPRAFGISNSDSEDSADQAKKRTAPSVTHKKRSFSSFANSNRTALEPNSRRSRATDTQRSSTSNSGKDLFQDRHEHRGRSRERRGFTDTRDMSPRLRAFLDREEAREAREVEARHHNEFRGFYRGDFRPYRGYRGHGRGRGRGNFDQQW
ncbi:hypothetical protein VE03_05384 [Pseudogymnoascus sp. 23342-1-I1]|nr:hypothetical protein VE03_05384 [Pseudogymnoascus sp. 23342-1-I1]